MQIEAALKPGGRFPITVRGDIGGRSNNVIYEIHDGPAAYYDPICGFHQRNSTTGFKRPVCKRPFDAVSMSMYGYSITAAPVVQQGTPDNYPPITDIRVPQHVSKEGFKMYGTPDAVRNAETAILSALRREIKTSARPFDLLDSEPEDWEVVLQRLRCIYFLFLQSVKSLFFLFTLKR